jgi:hypothetical protein
MRYPRDFANEYEIGVATTAHDADQYNAEGWDRITREDALKYLSRRGDQMTSMYVSAFVDGQEVESRFMLARNIRRGMYPPIG